MAVAFIPTSLSSFPPPSRHSREGGNPGWEQGTEAVDATVARFANTREINPESPRARG